MRIAKRLLRLKSEILAATVIAVAIVACKNISLHFLSFVERIKKTTVELFRLHGITKTTLFSIIQKFIFDCVRNVAVSK